MIGSQEWCQLYNILPVGFASFLFFFLALCKPCVMEQGILWCQFLNLPVGVVMVLEALYTRVICSDCKNNTQCGCTSRTRAIVLQETPLLQTKRFLYYVY